MLTSEQMLSVNKWWLLEYRDFAGVWVVFDREGDVLRLVEANSEYPDNTWAYVDDEKLSVYQIKA